VIGTRRTAKVIGRSSNQQLHTSAVLWPAHRSLLREASATVARLLHGSSKVILAGTVKPADRGFASLASANRPRIHGTAAANCLAANDLNHGSREVIRLSAGAARSQIWWYMIRIAAPRVAILCGLFAISAAVSRSSAQAVSPAGSTSARREFESRSELEAQAAAAEAGHRTSEAWLLRQRLTKGDFQDGDRIALSVQASAIAIGGLKLEIPDTVTVRAGKRVNFGSLGELSLDGVLRSELTDKIHDHLAQYLRDPSVHATPLVRIGILGQVGRPGYFYSAADRPLSDVIMQAGGPAQDANINGVQIKRGTDVIWNAQDTHTALADGLSIDRMHMRAGDEIYVPPQRHFPWISIISLGLSIVGLAYVFARN